MKLPTIVAVLLCRTAPLEAQVAPYDTVRVAEGIIAFVPKFTASAYVSGNITLIVGDQGAVVVDAGHFPAQSRSIVNAIRSVINVPVRALIVTHWHPDHWIGLAEFRRAFPGLSVASTSETRRMISTAGARFLAQYKDSAFSRTMADMAAKGTYPNGAPLSPAERIVLNASVPVLEWAIPGWRGVALELPDVTFDSTALRWHLGKREVEVRYSGRGNTEGDAIILVPDVNVVVAGDLVVAPTPYAYGAFTEEWLARLREIMALRPAALVPGHGEVQRDTAYVSQLVAVIESVRAQIIRSRAAGRSMEEARRQLQITALTRRFTGGNPELEAAFEMHFLAPLVQRVYAESPKP